MATGEATLSRRRFIAAFAGLLLAHTAILAVLGSFGAVIGGMLGVGIFHFEDPLALSMGGMISAAVFAAFIGFTYRWGIRGLL